MASSPPPTPATRRICAVRVSVVSTSEASTLLADAIKSDGHVKLAFANAHFVNQAQERASFREILPAFTILPDGIGVDIASTLLYGAKFPANLNGTDFVPAFLASHAGALKVRLIGAKPGIADKAARALNRLAPQHEILALSHGYFSRAEEEQLLAGLAQYPADVLLVAFGNPAQEEWIARAIGPAHARIAIGVGALFDFLAQNVVRAPAWVRAMRLEWVWRLAQEPRRLWRRYVLGNPVFLLRVLRQKIAPGAGGGQP